MTSNLPQLRAMNVGELLDAAFRLYRRNFLLFIGIIAVIQIPLTLLMTTYQVYAPVERFQATSGDVESIEEEYGSFDGYFQDAAVILGGQLMLGLLSLFAVQGLMNGAMARAVYDRYLGQARGLVDTYRALGWRWFRLALALVVLGILDFAILLLVLIPCLGWVGAPILLIYINVPIMSLLAPVIIIEGEGIISGLRRAFGLGRQNFWRVFGINILLWLLTMILTFPLSILLNLFVTFWDPSYNVAVAISSLVTILSTLLVRPISVCGLTLLYFDLRVRLEGFDLELMVDQMNAEATL
jgi:hypothetical protein